MLHVPFKLIDHPSDVAIEVEGTSLANLFQNAAEAMLMVISEEKVRGSGKAVKKRIHLDESSSEELLHSFLTEILWLLMNKGYFPLGISITSIERESLDAVLTGITVPLERIKVEIKAVTYHQLHIKKRNGKLYTRIIFDI